MTKTRMSDAEKYVFAEDRSVAQAKCSQCKTVKPVDAFHKRTGTRFGIAAFCIPCYRAYQRDRYEKQQQPISRNAHLLSTYGITMDEYAVMLQSQGGVCFICQKELYEVVNGRSNSMHVDHCHKSGKVRGILCGVCNRLLGYVEKDGRLDRLNAYLKAHQS